nr:MFS transporter [Actinospica robiniae]
MTGTTRAAAANPAATRMRVLITAYFLLDGFVFANWVVRVPQIKAHVGASAGMLGLALLGVSVGAIATMTITGRLCRRFGTRPVAFATSLLLACSVALPGVMPNVATLAATLFVFGAAWGGMNVAINSAAVDIIGELDRPVMPAFHAAYSLGGLLGSVVGGAVADYASARVHLAAVGAASLVAAIGIGVPLLRCPALSTELRRASEPTTTLATDVAAPDSAEQIPSTPHEAHVARQVNIVVAIFSIIVLCSSFGEGAMADWGALHLRTDLHTSAGLAAAGYASFSVAMFVGRLSGSWVLRKIGRTAVLAGGGLLAAAGMLGAALLPQLPVVLIGFVLVGIGLSNSFPAAVGQAGVLRGPSGVATASTVGYGGFLTGPPLIGFLADRLGLPIALTSISVLAALAAAIALLTAHQVKQAESLSRGEAATALV